MMRRFFCPEENIFSDRIIITDKPTAHHMRDVLRIKEGDKVIIFDGKEREFECRVTRFEKNQVVLSAKKIKRTEPGPFHNITLACALTKKIKFDYIIEKSTELGVGRIIPIYTKRCIIDLKRKEDARLEHWRRIIQNASEQSRRLKLPEIDSVQDFAYAVNKVKDYKEAFIACLEKDTVRLFDILKKKKITGHCIIFIGPEGDFTACEIRQAKDAGCIPVRLTDTVLKVDTACIYAVSLLVSFTEIF